MSGSLQSASGLHREAPVFRLTNEKPAPIRDILSITSHRPWPLPQGRWKLTQRWNDVLFAHWPVPAMELVSLIPPGLALDTFDGSAWVGVVPFWMDQIRARALSAIPGASRFLELNLRTYVHEPRTNRSGVYFFSLDAASLPAVLAARAFYHLPYYWSRMNIQHTSDREFLYSSVRRFTRRMARFLARYRSLGQMADRDDLTQFLTERYVLYTTRRDGSILRGQVHHLPWPLERAEAEFEINELPAAHGIALPDTPPLLHYCRELVVYVWETEPVHALYRQATASAVPAASQLE